MPSCQEPENRLPGWSVLCPAEVDTVKINRVSMQHVHGGMMNHRPYLAILDFRHIKEGLREIWIPGPELLQESFSTEQNQLHFVQLGRGVFYERP